MTLDDLELAAAYLAVNELMRARRRIGASVPEEVRRLHYRLDLEIRTGGPSDDEPDPGPSIEQIGTAAAARILGCTERHARRLAADLEGVHAGRDWVFNRAVVEEYAKARLSE